MLKETRNVRPGSPTSKPGADFRTRTGDPILTMDVLYLLS